MVKIAWGKSDKWYSECCCVCGQRFKRTEVRYTGYAVFEEGDTPITVLAHEDCAKVATKMLACEQLARGEFGE